MQEYEVTLDNGVTTTMLLNDEDAKHYNAKALDKPANGTREVAADTTAKRSRATKETR